MAELKNVRRELHYFQVRLGVAGAVVLGAFTILFARFFYLQVVQHQYYDTKAEDNRIAIMPIQPNRGLILDRNGVVLARNYSAYRSEEHTSELQSLRHLVCRLLLEKKKHKTINT